MKKRMRSFTALLVLISITLLLFISSPLKVRGSSDLFTNQYFYKLSDTDPLTHRFYVPDNSSSDIKGAKHEVKYSDFKGGQFTIAGTFVDNHYYMYKLETSDLFKVSGDYYLCIQIAQTHGVVDFDGQPIGIWQSAATTADATKNSKDGKYVQNPNDNKYYYLTKHYEGEDWQQGYIRRMNDGKYVTTDFSIKIKISEGGDPTPIFNDFDCANGLAEGKEYSKEAYAECFFPDKSANFVITKDLFKASDSEPPTVTIEAHAAYKRPRLDFVLGKVVAANSRKDIDQNHFFFISKQYPNLVIKFINCDMVGYFFTADEIKDPKSFNATGINTFIIRSDMKVTIDDSIKADWWKWFINKVYNVSENGTLYGETAENPVGTCPDVNLINLTNEGWLAHWDVMKAATADECDGPWSTSIGVVMARAFCSLGVGMHNTAVSFMIWANSWLNQVIGLNKSIKSY